MKNTIDIFDKQFLKLHERSLEFTKIIEPGLLFGKVSKTDGEVSFHSVGSYLLRSAGAVEQTFGGITTKLWDDPFEWTLPEYLSGPEKIGEYLQEVENTRIRGFSFLISEQDLLKQIPAPSEMKTILEILLDTIARAENFQGRAFALFRSFSDGKLPKF